MPPSPPPPPPVPLSGNLFSGLPAVLPAEDFAPLASGGRFRLLRIVSTGQATPPGEWYDQAEAEWVLLLQGRAGLTLESGNGPVSHVMERGDFLLLPAHCRHRVDWTAQNRPTVWLALHYDEDAPPPLPDP